jgi:hypothetical protein
MLNGMLLTWYLEASGLVGLFVAAFPELWIATPWMLSLATLGALWWFFGRKDQ